MVLGWHVGREHKFADEFTNSFNEWTERIKWIFKRGDYLQIFGFIEFFIRHHACPNDLKRHIEFALERGRAAYRIQDGSIIPVASKEEADAVRSAFRVTQAGPYKGARAHLLKAGEALTAGRWAESVRESIHAVESVVTVLEPSAGSVAKALSKLEEKERIHPALKSGFGSLYGYTSDEKGIRHPLVDDAVADVDETDAVYMHGSCAAFITYLIGKASNSKANQ